MLLSDDKINHLSHLLIRELRQGDVVFRSDEMEVLREIKRLLRMEVRADEEADAFARGKLESYSRKVFEGSPEWSVLYQRFHEEAMRKRRS
ncbi:MAG: DUF507 family protein [Nitrospirae bacterium]|nr:DUF507 family protein [Nitrospirota bacterium]